MKFYSPKLYLKDPWILVPTVVSLLCVLVPAVYLFFMVPNTETTYFLHTTVIFGVDLVGPYGGLYYPVYTGAVFCVLSSAAAFILYGKERFLSRFTMLFLALIELGIAYGVYRIVGLNV